MTEIKPYLQPGDQEIIRIYLEHQLPFFLEGGPGIGKSLAARFLGYEVYSAWCRQMRPDGPHARDEGNWVEGCICHPSCISHLTNSKSEGWTN